MIQNYTTSLYSSFPVYTIDPCATDPFKSQVYCLGERLVKPAIDCCCRNTSKIIRCTQNIFDQFFIKNEECREEVLCVPGVPSFPIELEELNQLKGEINALEIELAETFFDCQEIDPCKTKMSNLQENFALKIQQADDEAQQIILNKMVDYLQTDFYAFQEAAKLFANHLLTNTLEANFNLLTRLNTHFPLSARHNPFREIMIDSLWLVLSRAYLDQGNLDIPKKILLEDQRNVNSRLRLQGASLELLKAIIEKHFELEDIPSVKATIDSMEKRSVDLDPDYVTDEVINFSVLRCVKMGRIADAIDLSAMKPIPNDQAEILLTAIERSLNNGQLEDAKTLAAAIPEAQVLGNIYPRSSIDSLPLTWHRDMAQDMITRYIEYII